MKSFILALFLTFTSGLFAQDFEGTMTYSVDFTVSKKMTEMGVTKEMLQDRLKSDSMWADTIQTSYKGGFYRQLNIGSFNSLMIYRPDSNKIFSFQDWDSSEVCVVTNPSIDLETQVSGKKPSVKLLDTLISYNGFQLQMVEVKWKSGSYFYLFDENHFKMNPNNYKGHIYDGFYAFLKISKCLPIMIIKEIGPFSIRIALVESKEHVVEENIFDIPELIEDPELISIPVGNMKTMKIIRKD